MCVCLCVYVFLCGGACQCGGGGGGMSSLHRFRCASARTPSYFLQELQHVCLKNFKAPNLPFIHRIILMPTCPFGVAGYSDTAIFSHCV